MAIYVPGFIESWDKYPSSLRIAADLYRMGWTEDSVVELFKSENCARISEPTKISIRNYMRDLKQGKKYSDIPTIGLGEGCRE